MQSASILVFRPFTTDPRSCSTVGPDHDSRFCLDASKYLLELPVLFFVLAVLAAYKAGVFLYACVCRTLTNAFREWNEAAISVFCCSDANGDQQTTYCILDMKSEPRYKLCSMEHLVESHFLLLKTVKAADDVLGIIAGSYFGTQVNSLQLRFSFLGCRNKDIPAQVITVCFEVYYLVSMGLSGGWLTVSAFLILLQTAVIMLLVSLSACAVAEEASLGFEAVRGAMRNAAHGKDARGRVRSKMDNTSI